MLWKITLGMLLVSVGFGGWQLKRVEGLKVELSQSIAQVVYLQGNLADVLKDRMRDEEIEGLTDAEKLDLARDRGWLRPDTIQP